jgi:hypothetical protein
MCFAMRITNLRMTAMHHLACLPPPSNPQAAFHGPPPPGSTCRTTPSQGMTPGHQLAAAQSTPARSHARNAALQCAELTERAPIEANTCGCGDLTARNTCGPLLRFAGFNPSTSTWQGSALFVTRHCSPSQPPQLTWRSNHMDSGSSSDSDCENECVVLGEHMDSFHDWTVWRFELLVPVREEEQVVAYSVGPRRNMFYVPGGCWAGAGQMAGCRRCSGAALLAARSVGAGLEAGLGGWRVAVCSGATFDCSVP